MSDDPWAQFPSTPPAAASSGDDPWSKFPISPGGATAAAVKPSPFVGGLSNPANWALAGLDHLGMGLGTKNPFMDMPDQLKQDVAQAHQNLGLADYPLAVAAYAVGPGKIFGPAGKLIGGAGIGGTIAEGALAGGASSVIADPTNPIGALYGAAGGAALGGAAHGLGKVVDAGVQKAFGSPGAVDPAAAVATTQAARDAAYAPLKKIVFDPNDVMAAHSSTTLTPGMAADVSPGMNSMMEAQQKAIQNGGATANDIADYVTNLKSVSGSPSASNGDKLLAGGTAGKLEDMLGTAKPITGQAAGEAADVLAKAKAAHQQYANAQALEQWQQQLKGFGTGPGGEPQKIAETFYKPGDPQYQTLSDISDAAKAGMDPSYGAAHMGGAIGAGIGGAVGGWPGSVVGHPVGYYGTKYLAKKVFGNAKNTKLQNALLAAYPNLTGIQPTGASQAPQVGDMIKNLMLGSAY